MADGRRYTPRIQWLAGALLLATVILAGCGGGGSASTTNSPTPTSPPSPTSAPTTPPTTPPTATLPANTTVITVRNFSFGPNQLTIKKGMTVVWKNTSDTDHTATSDAGAPASFDGGVGADGGTFSFTFSKPGTYHYHCAIHPFMKGTIVVTA